MLKFDPASAVVATRVDSFSGNAAIKFLFQQSVVLCALETILTANKIPAALVALTDPAHGLDAFIVQQLFGLGHFALQSSGTFSATFSMCRSIG